MIVTGTMEASRASRNRRILPNGAGVWRSELIIVEGGPQAFLVEQDPHSVVLPHFHLEDEFQVIVTGDGTLGRHPVRPITVHFANRHTGYGPLTAGRDGVTYMTLRAKLDLGAHWLPESRHEMKDVPRRNLRGKPIDVSEDVDLRNRKELSLQPLIAVQEDGLAAWALRVAPHQTVLAPPQSGDRFYLVVNGEMRLRDERLIRNSVAFVAPNDSDFNAVAGDAGLELAILQFPKTH
jgi:hypothetical protein